ncbi:C-type mannose receptor 2-like isoform X2 [Pomacea canaliculata]|uniref:C-type mannose receptor 2-like isoform X2 n=1 Tax=Pomacea canaliculata TaxID=400727 RepID=UPI000D72A06C|nr:C-type mannose receptor 2-like isoform X2 [Pomacea canaliculata]
METLWNMTRPHSWWIDRRTSLSKGVWKWLDSESVFSSQLTPWDRSESTDGEDTRDCAEMDHSGLLNDVQCNSSLRFVCEKPLEKNPNRCDPLELNYLTAGCYRISTLAMSWWQAQETCYKKGGNLLSISSLDEQTDMLIWLRRKSKRWWVGLKRISPGVNEWSWLDSAVKFSSLVTPWETKEPNNMKGKEECVEISPRGQLNDESCSSTLRFICEKSSGRTGENGAEDCGVDWFLFNRRCYHLSTNTQSWFNASKICQEKGGNLLSINSLEELEIIRKEIRKKSERWWVGLRKISPTNSSSHDMTQCCCEEMTRGGHLNYADCRDLRPFRCKKQIRAENTTRTIDCGSGWFLISGVCLKLSTKTMSWSQSQESCKVEGGNLMSTSTLNILTEVKILTNLGSSQWWIGERTTSLKCVAISSSGYFHVEDCNTAHPYICEKRQLETWN